MESIENTQRKITKLDIELGFHQHYGSVTFTVSAVAKIIEHFSDTIKYLRLRKVRMTMSDFLHILTLVPNAECLIFSEIIATHAREPVDQTSLTLHQLKSLELDYCNDEILAVFSRLPDNVLTKLKLDHETEHFDTVAGLFTQQSNIRDLQLSGLRTI